MSAPRPTRVYDVAVLGTSLPGLVAAALLAQRGLRVLHVATAGAGTFSSGGWQLPVGPELLPAPRLVPAIRETLDELTLAAPVQRALQPIPLQVLTPTSRLELSDTDLLRGLGPAAEAFFRLRDRLATAHETTTAVVAAPLLPGSLGERFRLWNHVRRQRRAFADALDLEGARRLEEALLDLHRFASADAAERPTAFSFTRATAPVLQGLHRLPQGGLVAQLVGHVRSRRGDALDARVEGIALERGRFAGLRIGEEIWRARSLVAALPAEDLAELLPGGSRRRLEHFGRAAEPTPLVLRNLVLAGEGVPPGLGPLALASGFSGASALLQLGPAHRVDGRDDPGARTLTLAAMGEPEAIDRLLEEVLPFHQRHLRHQAEPPVARRLFRMQGKRELGFEGLPIDTPVRGIFHAGPEVLLGLGLEGAFLAGRQVAARVQARQPSSQAA